MVGITVLRDSVLRDVTHPELTGTKGSDKGAGVYLTLAEFTG